MPTLSQMSRDFVVARKRVAKADSKIYSEQPRNAKGKFTKRSESSSPVDESILSGVPNLGLNK